MSRISPADFPAKVLAVFPELEEELLDYDGLPHVQIEAFARLMQQAKGAADWEVYAPAAHLADELWQDADDALRNVLNVSLLERLDFNRPRGPRAWSLLSPRLACLARHGCVQRLALRGREGPAV